MLINRWNNLKAKMRGKQAFRAFQAQADKRFALDWSDRMLQMNDATAATGFDAHYVYHPAWAARILAKTKPAEHVDIASTLHFCSMISAWLPVKFYDYRPAKLNLSNLSSGRADLTALDFSDGSIKSLSCLHTIEHIGLGRYGDPLDPAGDIKAAEELSRVLAPGGDLLIAVPVGEPRIMFNAHRIYSFQQVLDLFPGLRLENFALVDDQNDFHDPADPEAVSAQRYGCGCFWFKK